MQLFVVAAAALLLASNEETICFEGYVVDRYCIDRGSLLDNPSQAPLESPGPAVQCVDANSRCGDWAKAGECSRNPQFMRSNCMKSCDLCNESRFQQPSS